MDEGRTFHPAREGDDVLCSDYVRAQSALERGIESDIAGGVDDNVDVIRDGLCLFFGIAEVCLGDVATPNDYLIVDETFERAAITIAQWIEGRRSDDVVPKTSL